MLANFCRRNASYFSINCVNIQNNYVKMRHNYVDMQKKKKIGNYPITVHM